MKGKISSHNFLCINILFRYIVMNRNKNEKCTHMNNRMNCQGEKE